MVETNQEWTEVIESNHSLFKLNLKEVWRYRDLVFMFVKRDFISSFKQTVLGPLWFFINPILTTVVFTFVFGGIANLPTDGIPAVLFYLTGTTLWGYFSSTLMSVSGVFTGNAGIFGKIYFPRLVTPISTIISSFMRLGIQLLLFFIVLACQCSVRNARVQGGCDQFSRSDCKSAGSSACSGGCVVDCKLSN